MLLNHLPITFSVWTYAGFAMRASSKGSLYQRTPASRISPPPPPIPAHAIIRARAYR